jgi:hypothetical protein
MRDNFAYSPWQVPFDPESSGLEVYASLRQGGPISPRRDQPSQFRRRADVPR